MNAECTSKYQNLKLKKLDNSNIYFTRQVFMFNRKMKLAELKEQSCQFWGLNPAEFDLFEGSDILLMRYEETVEMFFYSTIDAQRATPELILKVPERDYYVNEEDKINLPEDEEAKIKKSLKNKVIHKKAADIEKKYPGLSKYSRDGKRYKEIKLDIDSSIITFLVTLIILVLTAYTIGSRRDVTAQFGIKDAIFNKLEKNFNNVTSTNYSDEIGTLKNFINEKLPEFVTAIDEEKALEFRGGFRFITSNVKERECIRNFKNENGRKCYERYYNKYTRSIEIYLINRHK